jgi:CBS domain-containing protein
MALAGPLMSILLGGVGFVLRGLSEVWHWPPVATGLFSYLGWVNLALAAFNLIPAFPLDGGRVLRSVLWMGRKRLAWATRTVAGIGTGFAFLLMALGIITCLFGDFITGLWCWLIGMFVRSGSRMAYQDVVLRRVLEGQPVARFMNAHPVTVPSSTLLADVVENYVYRYNFSTFPVVENGHFLGCLSLKQLKALPRREWEQHTARSVVQRCEPEHTVSPETAATQALATMNRTRARRLMVVDHDRLLGVIDIGDLLNFLSRKAEMEGT